MAATDRGARVAGPDGVPPAYPMNADATPKPKRARTKDDRAKRSRAKFAALRGKALTATVRRQGGGKVVTIPAAVLRQLGVDEGTEMAFSVRAGKLVGVPVVPPAPMPRRRYTLADLLVGAEHLPEIYASVADTLDGAPVGHEIV